MEETKTTTPPLSTPKWVEDMRKWQQENPNERAVLCIADGNGETIAALCGKSLSLMAALLGAMYKDSTFAEVCKGALTAKENPIAALALMSAKEDSSENEDKPDAPSIKDSLKTFLSKLAEKL